MQMWRDAFVAAFLIVGGVFTFVGALGWLIFHDHPIAAMALLFSVLVGALTALLGVAE